MRLPSALVISRLALSTTVGLALARVGWVLSDPRLHTSDFHFYWRATRLWLAGVDPYALRPRTPVWPLWDRLFYPLPALVITSPLAALDVRLGQAVFVGAAAGLLAWSMTRDALWPLLVFLTPSFWVAAWLGQWSPWLLLGAVLPAAGFLLAAKPTLGLACWLYRPTWRAAWSGVAIVVLSLMLMPRWPLAWLDNLNSVQQHPAPLLEPGGFLLALAVLRWRRPDARLLIAMACMPQLLFFADQLPLFLIAKTRREAAFLVLSALVCFVPWFLLVASAPTQGPYAVHYVLLGCYAPALYVVLRRPDTAEPGSTSTSRSNARVRRGAGTW